MARPTIPQGTDAGRAGFRRPGADLPQRAQLGGSRPRPMPTSRRSSRRSSRVACWAWSITAPGPTSPA
jgi:hypothetical protein